MNMIRSFHSRRCMRRAIRHYVEVEYPATDRQAAYRRLANNAGIL